MAADLVTNLKVLKNYVYADVRVGWTDVSVATVSMRVSLGDPEMVEAMEAVNILISQRARAMVTEGINAEDMRRAIDRERRLAQVELRHALTGKITEGTLRLDRVIRAVEETVGPDGKTQEHTRYRAQSALVQLRNAFVEAGLLDPYGTPRL